MEDAQLAAIDLGGVRALSVLGRGAKGVAFLVEVGGECLALKTISRASVERKKSEDCYRRIWFERDVLKMLRHPLLPALRGFVETGRVVGFAIPHCPGGDLTSLRRRQTEKMFSPEVIKFYAAELVLVLEYLHNLGIVYRDLKPENIMIQETGHLMLIDFDLSAKLAMKSPNSSGSLSAKSGDKPANGRSRRRLPALFRCISQGGSDPPVGSSGDNPAAVGPSPTSSEKSNSFVGTEDYVAPEIVSGDGHDFAVDWWSLGVVLYEMLYGRTPFRGNNRKETFYRILTKSPDLAGEPTALRDLIGRLLEKEPARRVSLEGVKGHEFFRGVDWENVVRISRPPYIPAATETVTGAEEEEGIDVEEFVQRVFGGEEGHKEKTDLDTKAEVSGKKGIWVHGLSNALQKDDFLIF